MTVMFALLTTAFLGLMFLLIDSVRYRGLHAVAAWVTDMGNHSVFGEFEKKLLTDFDLFALDGAYGTGDFSIARVEGRLDEFVTLNTEPTASGLGIFCFDPWQLKASDVKITGHTLLSDGGGEALYQEAVAFMHKTAIMNVTGKLINLYQDAQDAEEKKEQYEQEKMNADREMEELEKQEAQKKQELEEEIETEKEETGGEVDPALQSQAEEMEESKKIKNPLPALARLAGKDILSIVCPGMKISEASVGRSELASGRKLKKGNLPVAKKYGGLIDNLIFREYLLDHLACCMDEPRGGKLAYEIEYLLGGKRTDRKNLKTVVTELLLIREGCNYLYCVSNEEMKAEAGAVATVLIGWMGIPALTAVLQHALMLGWAYAESLMDVRGIMAGGRVPLIKTPETWTLSLENLAGIIELLEGGGNQGKEGLAYREYLRILLNLQWVSEQKKRAVDLVELRVRAGTGLTSFKADQCLVTMKDEIEYTAAPLFSRVTGVFMGLAGPAWHDRVQGGFSYLGMRSAA